jgi:hypothetical protein
MVQAVHEGTNQMTADVTFMCLIHNLQQKTGAKNMIFTLYFSLFLFGMVFFICVHSNRNGLYPEIMSCSVWIFEELQTPFSVLHLGHVAG